MKFDIPDIFVLLKQSKVESLNRIKNYHINRKFLYWIHVTSFRRCNLVSAKTKQKKQIKIQFTRTVSQLRILYVLTATSSHQLLPSFHREFPAKTDGNKNTSFAPLTQLTDRIILHTCIARLGQCVSVSGMEEPSFGIIIMLACSTQRCIGVEISEKNEKNKKILFENKREIYKLMEIECIHPIYL
jgi:hypothetical protein